MNAILRYSAAAILLAVAAECSAETICSEGCDASTAWRDLNAIALQVSFPGAAGYAEWDGTFDNASNDFRLDTELFDGEAMRKGTILVVGGLVMAVQGEMVKPGLESKLLDGAALSQQLVYRLLDTALPQGPEAVDGVLQIEYASADDGMRLATTTAEGVVAAPWRVTGNVKKLDPGTVEYDLQLASGGPSALADGDGNYNPHLVGRLSRQATATLDGSMSLVGWRTYSADPSADDEVVATGKTFRTVADVRKTLAGEDTGAVDANRDFSGIWKEQCEDDFGLRIEHVGGDGRYLIAFCGPGGCENFDVARRSFIAGDSNYEIVSDNEIVQTGEQGGRQRYLRCMNAGN
jgi:hypothetical protein